GQQRIEFMIVASRARKRHAENPLRYRVDLLVVHVEQQLLLVLLRKRLLPQRQEASRDQAAAIDAPGLIGGKQVAGDLFPNEAVEAYISIEALDDVVAILIGVRIAMILVVAGG